jgi:hypothetical protein
VLLPVREKQMNYLLVFIGGSLGSSLRHTINVVSARAFGASVVFSIAGLFAGLALVRHLT